MKWIGNMKTTWPFYGWTIVGAAFLIGFTQAGVFQGVLAIFLNPMASEFGWSRSTITGAITAGSIFGGLMAPFIGARWDRYGPRVMSFFGILILSAGLFLMAFMDSAWEFYLYFGTGRGIAAGLLSLVSLVTVSNWFIKKRGRATGIAFLGPAVGGAVLPLVAQVLILTHGWRVAWAGLGIIVFLLSGLPAAFFLRRRPEDMGLLPDGVPPEEKIGRQDGLLEARAKNNAPRVSEPIWSTADTLRTPAFWMLTTINCLLVFVASGITFHFYPFMTDQGVPATSAVVVISLMSIFSAAGSLVWGYLAERFNIKKVLIIQFVLAGLFIALMSRAVHSGVIFAYGALFGLIVGGLFPTITVVWAIFYGRISLGKIQGLVNPVRLLANAAGPIVTALFFDLSGSYTIPFCGFIGICFLSALLVQLTGRPRGSP